MKTKPNIILRENVKGNENQNLGAENRHKLNPYCYRNEERERETIRDDWFVPFMNYVMSNRCRQDEIQTFWIFLNLMWIILSVIMHDHSRWADPPRRTVARFWIMRSLLQIPNHPKLLTKGGKISCKWNVSDKSYKPHFIALFDQVIKRGENNIQLW